MLTQQVFCVTLVAGIHMKHLKMTFLISIHVTFSVTRLHMWVRANFLGTKMRTCAMSSVTMRQDW